MRNVSAVAGIVIKELYRRKDFYVLFVLTAVITVAAGSVRFFDDAKIARYIKDLCIFMIWVSALFISIATAARQIPAERESRTIFPLLAKPVTRGQFILGKFFGCWLASGLVLVVFYLFFGIITAVHEQTWPVLNYLQAFLLQWAMLGIVTAMTLLGSLIFSAASVNITIIFIIVAGILFLGSHLNTIALRNSEPLQSIIYTVYFLIPHLELFDLRERLVNSWALVNWLDCGLAMLYAAVYTALFLLLTWLGFFSPEKPEHLMKKVAPGYFVLLLLAAVFTLATLFVPRAAGWNGQSSSDNGFAMMLGEGRKLFANQSFVMADAYFHAGFYPSMFDQHEENPDVAAPAHGLTDAPDSTDEDFRGPPKDWLDRFSRCFQPNKHVHLDSGGATGKDKSSEVREILPWLRLSSDLNPQMIEPYTVAAYWLRNGLKQPKEAEAFLREGLRNNPDSYELLFELGRLYNENYHDTARARNVWEAAVKRWHQREDLKKEPDEIASQALHNIATELAHLELKEGHDAKAIEWLEIAKAHSRIPEVIQKQIDELKAKLAQPPLMLAPKASD